MSTGLVTRGLVEGLGAVGPASRGLITATAPDTTPRPGPVVVGYQPRHWITNPQRPRWRRRVR